MRLRPFWTSCGRVVLAKKKKKVLFCDFPCFCRPPRGRSVLATRDFPVVLRFSARFAIFRVPHGRLVLQTADFRSIPPPRAFCDFPGPPRPFSTRNRRFPVDSAATCDLPFLRFSGF